MDKTSMISQSASLAGRDIQGRFQPGNRAAVGRPSTSRKNLAVFRAAITKEDIETLAFRLLDMAQQGDIRAAAILLQYCLPRAADIPRVEQEICREIADKRRMELLSNPSNLLPDDENR